MRSALILTASLATILSPVALAEDAATTVPVGVDVKLADDASVTITYSMPFLHWLPEWFSGGGNGTYVPLPHASNGNGNGQECVTSDGARVTVNAQSCTGSWPP